MVTLAYPALSGVTVVALIIMIFVKDRPHSQRPADWQAAPDRLRGRLSGVANQRPLSSGLRFATESLHAGDLQQSGTMTTFDWPLLAISRCRCALSPWLTSEDRDEGGDRGRVGMFWRLGIVDHKAPRMRTGAFGVVAVSRHTVDLEPTGVRLSDDFSFLQPFG